MPPIVTYTAYLEGSLTLTAEGEWLHEGKRITHDRIAKLFHRSIVWDAATSQYRLQIGREGATFTCEDTPYFVQNLAVRAGVLFVQLISDAEHPVEPPVLRVGTEDQLYAAIAGMHRARLLRGAHQQALAAALDNESLELNGVRIRLQPEER